MTPDELTGSRVRALRKSRGLSQAELGGDVLSASYLSMIESGARRASAAALRHLADRLGTTVDHLALGLEPDCRAAAESRLALARLALRDGRPADCLTLLDEGGPGVADSACRWDGEAGAARIRALEDLGRTEQAVDAYETRLARLEADSPAWAEAAADLVRRHLADGAPASAAVLAERALAVFTERDLLWSEPAVRLATHLAEARARQGDSGGGHALLAEVARALRAHPDDTARATAYESAATAAHRAGRHREAHTLAERALALHHDLDRRRDALTVRALSAVLLADAEPDRLADAVEQLHAARAELLPLGPAEHLTNCELALAEHLVRAGSAADAHRFADAVLQRLGDSGHPHEARARLAKADALLCADDTSAAARQLDLAVGLLDALPPDGDRRTVECWRRAAGLHRRLGDTDAAMRAYDRALHIAGHTLPRPARSRADLPGG
ncbi:helix-turn-helix transcriptional regulator [Streptomyces sp. TLI_171]|uniref:helix-turn-helix domain-containing protein n=1 Tax=Streptomyces sp. TLI_171 TaxID=1938859 RepID=UPI000C5B0A58|nr:helix-turn-helix transcriptional regulator [Streptomyces sp. TLI_171]RKE22415.1 helix-turn-helix protein [Streptomyces sp. TLI_171]